MRVIGRYILFALLSFLLLLSNVSHAGETRTPIKHVIIIIDENHSFDNLFGTYPFGFPPVVNNVTLSVMLPDGLYENYTQLGQSRNGVLYWISVPNVPWFPFLGYSHPYYANAYSTVDPHEGWKAYHGDYWFGEPIGFVYYSGSQSMAYFSYQQAWILWDYAEEYVLADNYFAPVLGLTEPNRVAYLTGLPPDFYSDYVSWAIPYNETIFYQLSLHNVSWGYYVIGYKGGIPFPLNAFDGIQEAKSHIHSLSDFFDDLKNGSLPAVSWVMLMGCGGDYYDMLPPYNIATGEVELASIINAVMESVHWNSTVIFITFDEGGGYYDHVVPPAINHYGLGQRVPLLVISPYAKEGWVDNYTMSGYTLLAFIDYNWGLPWLTKWVEESDVQGLLSAFNFSSPPRPPIILTPNNWSYPLPLQYPIHYGYIAKVPTYPSYAQVYPAPALQFLLPLELTAFVLVVVGLKKKSLITISMSLFLVALVISVYYYKVDNIYAFVSEYYAFTSFIGFVASSILYLHWRKRCMM